MGKYLLTDLTPTQLEFFLKYVYNGVGSDELGIDPPDSIFKGAAKGHDFRCFVGGTDHDRIESDKEFLKDCLDRINKSPVWKRPLYKILAYVYYFALWMGSKYAWEYYDKPAENWEEFIKHVIAYHDREKEPYPWAGLVLDPFTV